MLLGNLQGFAQEAEMSYEQLHPFYGISNLVMTDREFSEWLASQDSSNGPNNAGMIPVSLSEGDPIQAHIEKMSYLFGPGDVVSVNVEGHLDFSRQSVRVNNDGWISLPLVGEVKFSNRRKDDVTAEISEALQEYLLEPKVHIVIDKPRPQFTYVLGAVKNAGPYKHVEEMTDPMLQNRREVYYNYDFHLTTAVENAGGVLENADLRNVHVFNKRLGYRKKADLFSLIVLGDISQDISMNPDDVIYIPRLTANAQADTNITKLVANSKIGTKVFPVKVFGHVKNPNVYELGPQEMTLQTALAKAGGPLQGLANDNVIVARTMPNGRLKKITVDADDEELLLQPNDIIMVSDTTFIHKVDRVLHALSEAIFRSSFAAYNADRMFNPID
jgi:protein involved in polysaccharide export with SLBB domain